MADARTVAMYVGGTFLSALTVALLIEFGVVQAGVDFVTGVLP